MIRDFIYMKYIHTIKYIFFSDNYYIFYNYYILILDEKFKIVELSYFSSLDTATLSTTTKPKMLQTEEVNTTGNNHNVTANISQDREFILFENERIMLMLCAC